MSDYRELIAEEQGVELQDAIEIIGTIAENIKISGNMWAQSKCEYCEVDVDDRKYLFVVEDSYYECNIYIDGNGNLTDDTFNKKINYCPMCGRKL